MSAVADRWLVRATVALGILGILSGVAALLAVDGDAALAAIQARNVAWGTTAVVVGALATLRRAEAFVALWTSRTLFEVGDLAVVGSGLVQDVPLAGILVFLVLDLVALVGSVRWVRG